MTQELSDILNILRIKKRKYFFFKKTMIDVLNELADKWDELSEENQNSLCKTMAGDERK